MSPTKKRAFDRQFKPLLRIVWDNVPEFCFGGDILLRNAIGRAEEVGDRVTRHGVGIGKSFSEGEFV